MVMSFSTRTVLQLTAVHHVCSIVIGYGGGKRCSVLPGGGDEGAHCRPLSNHVFTVDCAVLQNGKELYCCGIRAPDQTSMVLFTVSSKLLFYWSSG